MKIMTKFRCPGCETHFVDDSQLVPSYTCEECSTVWPKDDGRNCEQCHKFGRSTDSPLCPECDAEVEEQVFLEVDPDEVNVLDKNGGKIMTKKRKIREKESAELAKKRKAEEIKRGEAAERELAKLVSVDPGFHSLTGGVVVAFRKLKLVDSEVTVYACVRLSASYALSSRGLPFRAEFRIRSGGFRGAVVSDGGFDFSAGIPAEFATAEEAASYAASRVREEEESHGS